VRTNKGTTVNCGVLLLLTLLNVYILITYEFFVEDVLNLAFGSTSISQLLQLRFSQSSLK